MNRWDRAQKCEKIREAAIAMRGEILANDLMAALRWGSEIADALAEIQTDNSIDLYSSRRATKKAIAEALGVPYSMLRDLRREEVSA